MRPDRDAWHLDGTRWLAQMGDCTRRKVGALIVGPDKRFWGMGYNGSYPGGPSCLEGACPRGRHYEAHKPTPTSLAYTWARGDEPVSLCACGEPWPCNGGHSAKEEIFSDGHPAPPGWEQRRHVCACGKAWPCPEAVAPGSAYDTGPGACIASHAEANAVSDAQRKGHGALPDATLYVSCEPCEGCVRHIRNTTQIAAIRWPDGVIGLP